MTRDQIEAAMVQHYDGDNADSAYAGGLMERTIPGRILSVGPSLAETLRIESMISSGAGRQLGGPGYDLTLADLGMGGPAAAAGGGNWLLIAGVAAAGAALIYYAAK